MKFLIVLVSVLAATVSIDAVCRDMRADCGGMTLYCKLKVYEDFVRKWCPKTCGFCGGGQTQPPPETRPPIHTVSPITKRPTFRPPTAGPPSGSCGNPAIQGVRVIAGTTPIRGAWPWQILMSYNGRPGCGGSLVSPTWVVTAAHCVSGKEHNARSFFIRVGEHNRNMNEGSERDMPVSRVISHPGYNKRTMDNDIAMIKLASPVTMDRYVSTVCLPNGDVPVGTECYITGWGKTRHPGSMTSVLQQGKTPVVSNSVCYAKNRNTIPIPITRAMVCSGNGGRTRLSGCHGDSGGPFVCRIGGRWELHGAVSHGSNTCESTKSYTVYARVNYFKSWIQSNMARY